LDADSATVRQWINDVASGNFDSVIAGNSQQPQDQLRQLLIEGYDRAFHGVLWYMFAAVLVLTLLIGALIRNVRKVAEAEA